MELLQMLTRRGGGGRQEVPHSGDRDGNAHVSQGLPRHTEITRQGGGYQSMTTAAVAGLVVRPSTVALFTLWNGEPDGGMTYIVDRAFAFNLVSGAAQAFYGIWLCLHPTGMTKPTSDITAIKSLSGKSGYGGKAILDVDATVVDDGWFPYGPAGEAEEVGVLPGGILEAPIEGKLLVPPSAGVSIHVVSSTVNEDFTAGFGWYEHQLDMS